MTRFPDWPQRLEESVRTANHKPFGYGAHDCCLFVADAVLAMTGVDLAARYRGRYHSREEALAVAGVRSVRELVDVGLAPLPAVPVLCAQRGDILLVKRTRDASLGLIALDGKAILAAGRDGLLRLPLTLGLRAWHV